MEGSTSENGTAIPLKCERLFLKSKEVIHQEISKGEALKEEAVLQEQVNNPIPTTHVFGLPGEK
jgi:hypothetical protein